MTTHSISTWLNSPEYHSQITATLTKITRSARFAKNEAETASIFESEIYFLIRKQLGIELEIQKERNPANIIHHFPNPATHRTRQGRMDAIVNNLVIEYKHHSKLHFPSDIKSAVAQVKGYLNVLKEDQNSEYNAILTDGTKISYFSFSDDSICNTSLRKLRTEDIDRIIRAMLSNKSKKFEPTNIVKDFSILPDSPSNSKQIATILYRQLSTAVTGKSQMLYAEWKELMHLSVEDNGKSRDIDKRRKDLSSIFQCNICDTEKEYKALFALQTTYSIIVKLIACKVLDNLNFDTGFHNFHDLSALSSEEMCDFFQRLEDGYSYNNMGIRNLLEGDFFSWYTDKTQWNDTFWENIKDIIITIDDYTAFSINVKYKPTDIFKDLYMSIIPQSIRHSMGEYFTPEWLADSVVTEGLAEVNQNDWSALDPCCGSGIFLISLIRKLVGDVSLPELTEEQKHNILNNILSRVKGIDINPLSVLSARVSYYLAIYPFGDIQDIEIPVYLGDSAIIAQTTSIDNIACYTYTIHNSINRPLRITLPQEFVEESDFSSIMDEMQTMVVAENVDLLFDTIYDKLSPQAQNSKTLTKTIRNLAEALVNLHHNNWDGIWLRIATNFMLIARLKRVDLITGNPPWVKWEHLPAEYTRRIKTFCDIRHIFSNDRGLYGGAQLNICALIANVAACNWLKDNGVLAFLMPDSLMSQNSYEEFRNFYIDYQRQ